MNIQDIIQSTANDQDLERLKQLPCAEDIFATLLRVIPFERHEVISVADLGSADGFLSALVLSQFPEAHITLIEANEERLNNSRERFIENEHRITCLHNDFARSDPPEKYDLIVSAFSIHNLNGIEKRALYRTLYSHVRPNGLFVIADRVKAPTEKLQDNYRHSWAEESLAAGASEADISETRARMFEDHESEIEDQLEWIRNAGFRNVDVYYKNLMFAVYGGHRPDY
ncbi:MAG: class I SAM-dependent methyltransferase [Alphaproteobacteria bacterium]|jgi:tRNA (cmo5U34)-methyltransferase|nr:class I SAM-dependent methyltransferase [Alphaproteobacteria bacterium]MBT4082355.1 class I SAM-dependent methyltransferase [Alphaproteobacteria bacterium]MBT4545457.1 class I SAM-dependent methyltransferase [Alphaproteobacteria bacterium]MBT7746457.1 class I SAM-dependent methyltransferase [Alphaproteobacteria bacterium]